MKTGKKLGWFLLGAVCLLAIEAAMVVVIFSMGDERPEAPPADTKVELPWGAVEPAEWESPGPLSARHVPAAEDDDDATGFLPSLVTSVLTETPQEFDADGDGVREYPLLALSGGGSKGAFGAGFLCGWSASGERPTFKVVTGVSTGALQATPAFLGKQYDPVLRDIYTAYDSDQIYTSRLTIAGLVNDSMFDSAPLRKLIATHMTEKVLAEVASEHAKGRRLFIGTMNMDADSFVIWDMGAIASSGRDDALEHYRSILLASCSAQVLLPPVYFSVQADGKTYHEMHADGATYSQAFFRGFLLEFDDAVHDAGISDAEFETDLYVIINGKVSHVDEPKAVRPRTLSIAAATVQHLLRMRITASLYRMYVLAYLHGAGFYLAAIPTDYQPDFDMMDFDQAKMQALFETGHEMAADGYDWMKHPPDLDPDEIFDAVER